MAGGLAPAPTATTVWPKATDGGINRVQHAGAYTGEVDPALVQDHVSGHGSDSVGVENRLGVGNDLVGQWMLLQEGPSRLWGGPSGAFEVENNELSMYDVIVYC